jgi:hypothetical protein
MMQNCLTACGTSRLRPQTLAELPKRRIAGIQSNRLFEHEPGRATASDNDGNLDLYVANYVKFTFENHVVHTIDGHPQYVGPRDYEPESHVLFRNNGDGTFTDVSSTSGISQHSGSGMGSSVATTMAMATRIFLY